MQTSSALLYLPDEVSFSVRPSPQSFTSVVIGFLSLEVDPTGKITHAWGVSGNWLDADLTVPVAMPGEVYVESEQPFKAGVSQAIVPGNTFRAPSIVDRRQGWVRIGEFGLPEIAVSVFPGIIVEIGSAGEFCSVWLHPNNGLPGSIK